MKVAVLAAAGRLLGRQQISCWAAQSSLAYTGEWDRLNSLATTAFEGGSWQTKSWESSTIAGVVVGRRPGVAKVTSGRQEPCMGQLDACTLDSLCYEEDK